MQSFEAYQHAFTLHLRDAKQHKKPQGVPDKRMAIYREIVFNNLLSVVSACFPVCVRIVGKTAWRRLVKQYLATQACGSPLFRDIPKEFLRFITEHTLLAQPILQLAHYEWAELAVSQMPVGNAPLSQQPDLLNGFIVLADAHRLLAYDYPVHVMSKNMATPAAQPTHLLMYLNLALEVRFILLNSATFQLLHLLKIPGMTGLRALEQLAAMLQHPQPEAVIAFGLETLNDLMRQEAILGTQTLGTQTLPINTTSHPT